MNEVHWKGVTKTACLSLSLAMGSRGDSRNCPDEYGGIATFFRGFAHLAHLVSRRNCPDEYGGIATSFP